MKRAPWVTRPWGLFLRRGGNPSLFFYIFSFLWGGRGGVGKKSIAQIRFDTMDNTHRQKKGGQKDTMANKSKYESHVLPKLELIEAWSRDGLTLEQIAHNLGIACSTLKKYKEEPDKQALADALARGREVVDVIVENALLKKCTGYDYTEIYREYKVSKDPDTGEQIKELVKTKETTRHVDGDVTAQMFWLANRKRAVWQYKPEPDSGSQDGETGVVELSAQDPEPTPPPELVAQAEAEMQQGGGL